jgi:hypothetical protein
MMYLAVAFADFPEVVPELMQQHLEVRPRRGRETTTFLLAVQEEHAKALSVHLQPQFGVRHSLLHVLVRRLMPCSGHREEMMLGRAVRSVPALLNICPRLPLNQATAPELHDRPAGFALDL